MIRILHVVNAMNCGGTENMLMNIYRNIDRDKIQFDFLVHSDKPAFFDEEIKKMGGRIFYAPRWNLFNFFSYRKKLHSLFKEYKDEFSWVHGHMGSTSCIYLSIAKKYGIKTVAHSHSANFSRMSLKNSVYLLLNRITRRVADFFFGCSYDAGICRYGKKITNSDKFTVIKNAIKLDNYTPDEKAKEKILNEFHLKDSFVVGHIGRFTYAKNHVFLIEVFKEILKIKKNSKLLLVGEGELREELTELIKKENLFDKVILTGVRNDVSSLLQVMDCFVFPSIFEGLGIAVIEAEAYGIPCFINTNLPKELDINPNVYRLSLETSKENWAKFIVENSTNVIAYEIGYDNVKKAGYDITDSVTALENFYLEIRK